MNPSEPFIQIDHVSLSYDEAASADGAVDALGDVDFAIRKGESVAVIGPSGCGKSSLLHLVAGLLRPSAGTVLIDGAEVRGPRRETAFIPQDLGIFPWKTVFQNAALGLTLRGMPKQQARERARAALTEVGLAGFEGAYPRELSGGMRQRLALARAIAMDADVLLMDEPLSAIDALLREQLQDMLLDFQKQRGHTQLLVTHSIEEAVYLGQRIIVLGNRPGTVVADVPNDDAGERDYRDTAAFSERCHVVRMALAQGGIADGTGEGDR